MAASGGATAGPGTGEATVVTPTAAGSIGGGTAGFTSSSGPGTGNEIGSAI